MDMDKFFNRLDSNHKRRENEFNKLLLDQCCIVPGIGDTVIVAAGLLGMGFDWIRLEAEVVGIGQNSIKVRFITEKKFQSEEYITKWIHPALVTDVIKHTEKAR